MEDCSSVGVTLLILTRGNAVEVPCCERHNLIKQLHHNSARVSSINLDVKEDPKVNNKCTVDKKNVCLTLIWEGPVVVLAVEVVLVSEAGEELPAEGTLPAESLLVAA